MLVVFAGLPGTGKTTLARLLAAEHHAAHLRVDAVEAALTRCGHTTETIGAAGYIVVGEVATSCLAVGTPVVIDAVSPVPEARHGWRALAEATHEHLVMVEVVVGDQTEHRRRIESRRSDVEGLTVPTWPQVIERHYQPWDEARDGPRLVLLNEGDPKAGLAAVQAAMDGGPSPPRRQQTHP